MAEKKYIAVNPNDGSTSELVQMNNPSNVFKGTLMSVNPGDNKDIQDVRDLFVYGVKVDGKLINKDTSNAKQTVDISPHVKLNPVAVDNETPMYSDWEILPGRTP
jgi:hypothetical protein